MNRTYVEIYALVFVAVLSLSLFAVAPRQYPHYASFAYALEAEKAISGGISGPFYELTKTLYFAAGGQAVPVDMGLLDMLVKYIPVALGALGAVAFYLAVRTRLGPVMGGLGAVFLVTSSSFLVNSMAGVYTPEMMSVSLFCVSLALFLSADSMKNSAIGAILALAAGLLLGYNMTVSEAGALLAGAAIASAVVQFVYYVKEREYAAYGVRVAALVLAAGAFIPYAKFADLGGRFSASDALVAYSFLLPLIALFAFVSVGDLIRDTKRYELFFLALALGSVGIALFDPVAAAPGLAIGAIFGASVAKDHLKEKMLAAGFVAITTGALVFSIMAGVVAVVSALALSALAGVLFAVVFLLYENEGYRRLAVFSGIALITGSVLLSGVVLAQKEYSTIDGRWGAALEWLKANSPQDAVVGGIVPNGVTEYVADRKGCCGAEVARYLLGGGTTDELKASGANYIIVDKSYFDNLGQVASAGNVTKPGLGVYLFAGYYQDSQGNFVADYISREGDSLRVPVDNNGFPLKQDVQVDSLGSIPYTKIKRFESDDLPITPGSEVAIPLFGARNNLFDMYFDVPNGVELVHSTGNGTVRIYRVS